MLMTILEAHVLDEKQEILRQIYRENITQPPPGLVRTYLVQSAADPSLWRILTVWQSREVLDEMRRQGTPGGVLMFRSAGAEPELSIMDIVEQA